MEAEPEAFDAGAKHPSRGMGIMPMPPNPRRDRIFSKKSFLFSAFHSSGTHELYYLCHPAHP